MESNENGFLDRMKEVNPELYTEVMKARGERQRREKSDVHHLRAIGCYDELTALPDRLKKAIEDLAALTKEIDSIKRKLETVANLPADMQHLKERVDRAGKFVGELVKVNRLKKPTEAKK